MQSFDPRNRDIQIFVGDRLYPRLDAKVSVFDSVVQGGDAVWEGLRLYKQGIVHLDAHLQRLRASAHALGFTDIPTDKSIREALRQTLIANRMEDEVHIRLTLTRGTKITSGMDPRLNQAGPTLIVLAEWKPLVYDNAKGIEVITSTQRRNGPAYLDSKIHHNNLLNNIIAKMQANVAGVNAAVMLDDRGFIAELNDTNVFMVKDGSVITPFPHACLPGITRRSVMQAARVIGLMVEECDISMTELYNADYAFATGTMGEMTPIVKADGRAIGNDQGRAIFDRVYASFREAINEHCEAI